MGKYNQSNLCPVVSRSAQFKCQRKRNCLILMVRLLGSGPSKESELWIVWDLQCGRYGLGRKKRLFILLLLSLFMDKTMLLWDWKVERGKVKALYFSRSHAGNVDSIAVYSSETKCCNGSWGKILRHSLQSLQTKGKKCEIHKLAKREQKAEQLGLKRTPLFALLSTVVRRWRNLHCTLNHTSRVWCVESDSLLSNLTGNKACNSISYLTPCKHLTSRTIDDIVD